MRDAPEWTLYELGVAILALIGFATVLSVAMVVWSRFIEAVTLPLRRWRERVERED